MRYEPGAMALCIDPDLPKQMVTLLQFDGQRFDKPAWEVRFPSAFRWPKGPMPQDTDGWVPQKYLIPIRPDADPVETEREIEVTA